MDIPLYYLIAILFFVYIFAYLQFHLSYLLLLAITYYIYYKHQQEMKKQNIPFLQTVPPIYNANVKLPRWFYDPKSFYPSFLNEFIAYIWPSLIYCLNKKYQNFLNNFFANHSEYFSLFCTRINFSNIPPHLSSVRSFIHNDRFIVDFSFQFNTKNIICDFSPKNKPNSGSNLQFNDIIVTGEMRLTFSDKIIDFPFFENIELSFLSTPDIIFSWNISIFRLDHYEEFKSSLINKLQHYLNQNFLFPFSHFYHINECTLHINEAPTITSGLLKIQLNTLYLNSLSPPPSNIYLNLNCFDCRHNKHGPLKSSSLPFSLPINIDKDPIVFNLQYHPISLYVELITSDDILVWSNYQDITELWQKSPIEYTIPSPSNPDDRLLLNIQWKRTIEEDKNLNININPPVSIYENKAEKLSTKLDSNNYFFPNSPLIKSTFSNHRVSPAPPEIFCFKIGKIISLTIIRCYYIFSNDVSVNWRFNVHVIVGNGDTNQEFITNTQPQTRDPVFDQTFTLNLIQETDHLIHFKVYDEDEVMDEYNGYLDLLDTTRYPYNQELEIALNEDQPESSKIIIKYSYDND